MSRIRNLLGLLKLLQASGGELETRIRIQKEAFLLALHYPDLFCVRDFEYHYYGPYSRSLSETLQFAVSSDLIEEVDESPEDASFTKFRYCLTEKGSATIEGISDEPNGFADWATRLNGYNWRALELASTVKFIEMNEGLDRDAAFQKALGLKPATASHKMPAQELLQSFH